MSPKPVKSVTYNDGGKKSFAIITGERSPENYDLLVKDPDSGGWAEHDNVPQGTVSGTWSDDD